MAFVPHQIDFEETPCPICQERRYSVQYPFEPYRVVRCGSCGISYLSPRLKEEAIQRFYASETYYGGSEIGYSQTNYRDQERTLRLTFRLLMRNLAKRHLTGGSLLEIGCGFGYLLDEAKDYFSFRAGTDFSEQALLEARKFCDTLFRGGVESVPLEERYDCIIANQVIEHVYAPREFLASLLRLVKPGGAIVVATPNMNSPLRYLLGRKWPSFKIPEHVIYFDSKRLAELLTACGLRGVSRIPYNHAFPLGLMNRIVPVPRSLHGKILWIPTTTVCAFGIRG